MMLVNLTSSADDNNCNASKVGGKASSLAKLYAIPALHSHVPKSYALSTSFFHPWIEILTKSDEYTYLMNNANNNNEDEQFKTACTKMKEACQTLPLNTSQKQVLDDLSNIIATQFNHNLAAVRSSATEEDGIDQSYAGLFETKLGISSTKLEVAVRECFASKFDYRVFKYMLANKDMSTTTEKEGEGGFAVVVMEMIDSEVAGVAFSANPLNSDRDEIVVDSSFGLGESVVDGSVTGDRFIYDKVQKKLVDTIIGSKKVERRLNLVEEGGVITQPIDDVEKQTSCSLPNEQLEELVKLICIVEEGYGMPMDIEWGVTESRIVLLQARPITTLFYLDSKMMTEPGEKRVLYYDFNIASEATTTSPFTHMDMDLYCKFSSMLMGMPTDVSIFKDDPNMPMFKASTRQYVNLSVFLKFFSPEYFAKEAVLMDPYLASLFGSKDCDRKKYKVKKLAKGINMKNFIYYLRKYPIMEQYKIGKRFKKNPVKEKDEYIKLVKENLEQLEELKRRGYNKGEGLQSYIMELIQCIMPSLNLELGLIMFAIMPTFRAIDKKRRDGKTEEIRSEFDALCGGYEGDELMEINIAMYNLAHMLDSSVWQEYEHDQLDELAQRIQMNLDGIISDLPPEFISEWQKFMTQYGWDGEDQMFISSPRYEDNPVLLLARLRNQNSGVETKNPSAVQKEQVLRRQYVMKLQESRAASKLFSFGKSKIKKRNAYLDHLFWIRNAPKLHIAAVYGALRSSILQVEEELINANRLETKNDIYHLDLAEVDKAISDESYNLMELVKPRKAIYERALNAPECPLLVDSRCRILRPDPPNQEDVEAGVIVGSAVSPGTATGRVRIMKSPTDQFAAGEILAATVTSPAWTPLFVGASGVILQIGGALQHGALCAREFQKPAVSNVDIHNVLKTGMLVTVDGNTGTIQIHDEEK